MTAITLPDGRTPVLLSAHTDDLVGRDAAAILDYLERRPDTEVADVAARLLRTRRLRRHRAVVRAAEPSELRDGLRALAADAEHPLVTRSSSGATSARIAFVFPGQGSQWPSMGVEAYERLPAYRAEAERCAEAFAAAGVASPMSYLLSPPDSGAATTDFSQVQIQGAQFVHGVALARVWRACGVMPDITVGHSLGEIGAAYVAGTLTLADAVGVVAARATLLDSLTGPYRVAVLGVTPAEAQSVIAETPGWLELSVVNSPTSVAVSGDTEAVAAAVRTVAARGSFAREIEMWFPAHTTALDPMRARLDALLPDGTFAEAPVRFIGAATATVVTAGTDFAGYWYTNLRSTVRFDRAVGAAIDCGATTFVELSAHPALLFAMGALLDELPNAPERGAVVVGSGRRDDVLTDRLSANVVAAALSDAAYRWADLLDTPRKALREFPFAPMRAEHHWAHPEPLAPIDTLTIADEHWQRLPMPAPHPRRARSAAVLGSGPVVDVLRAAVRRQTDVELVAPDAAELLIVAEPLADSGAVTAAARLGTRIDDGMLGYADAIAEGCRDVWLITAGGQRVGEDDPIEQPAQAALAAMHRSIGFEHPDQNFRHLDLPSWELDDVTAEAALRLVLDAGEDVALRGSGAEPRRYVRTLRDAPVQATSWSARDGVFDDVVITGGSGTVAAHYVRRLAELGAHRIVLLSRSGSHDAALGETCREHGVELLAVACDLTDGEQVATAAAEFGGDGATLVIHAAGAATIASRRALTGAAFADTCAAKVTGLDHLIRSWPLRADARVVSCSSVSGLWGGRGHAAYAAANRLLDVMTAQLRTDGRQCTAVRWGLWPGAGIIAEAEVARVQRSGLRPMPADRAVDASLREVPGDPLIFSADADRIRLFLDQTDAPDAGDVPKPEAPVTDSAGAVRTALAAVLKLADASGLDFEESLLDLGVDSLLAIDLRKKLKKDTGKSVPLATILGGVTATELIEHLEAPEERALSRD